MDALKIRPVHGGYPGEVPEPPRRDRSRCAMCGIRATAITIVGAAGFPHVCRRCAEVIACRTRNVGYAADGTAPLMTRQTAMVFYR